MEANYVKRKSTTEVKSRKIALPLYTPHFEHCDRGDTQAGRKVLQNTDSILIEAFIEMYLRRNSGSFNFCLGHYKDQTTH